MLPQAPGRQKDDQAQAGDMCEAAWKGTVSNPGSVTAGERSGRDSAKGAPGPCLALVARETGDVPGCVSGDVGAGDGEDLGPVHGPHHLAAARRDPGREKQSGRS